MSKEEKSNADLMKELGKVGEPDKPKKRVRGKQPKPKLPQKKRSSALKNRTRVSKETVNLAHITKAIVREGGTVPDVGMILACQDIEGGEQWLEELKERNLTVDEFLEEAKQRVDIDLIRVAVKAATGYSWIDEEEELEPVLDPITGEPGGKFRVVKKRRKPRKQAADTPLLKFLLMSRMPEYFKDTKTLEINKRVVEIKADAEGEIRNLCKGLLEAFGDPIEAEFVD
jgi:hypothetical protein